jgi:4-hydroxybenzoate polyprenyltransferase
MTEVQTQTPESDIPLVLDVDGTLLKTDLLYETFWAAMGHDFWATLRVLATHFTRPERLKHNLAEIARPKIKLLPLREEVLALAREAKKAGRPVHLVSGSDQGLIDALARHLGLPGPHFGSDPERNLTDATKAAFLKDRFGVGGYDYAGNARADLPAWAGARKLIAIAPGKAVTRRLEALGKPVQVIPDGAGLRDMIRELRPHQWVKNLLLFLPILASHIWDPSRFVAVAIATLAFSLGASSIYIINDLLDLEADRIHPQNRKRPIASGVLPIKTAMGISVMLALIAGVLAFSVSPLTGGFTLIYMAGSLSYSLWLKKRKWLDVLALSGLFLLRVLTGAIAAEVTTPPLLLGFCFAVFFALACVKRLTALTRMHRRGVLPGRGYSPADLVPLERVAFASIPVVALIFLSYIWGPHGAALYSRPLLASLVVVPIVLWMTRMISLSISGHEDYDPVRFVLHDRVGLVLVVLGVVLLLLSV